MSGRSTGFGIFDRTGCLETGLLSLGAAVALIALEPDTFGGAHAHPVCSVHPERTAAGCEDCE